MASNAPFGRGDAVKLHVVSVDPTHTDELQNIPIIAVEGKENICRGRLPELARTVHPNLADHGEEPLDEKRPHSTNKCPVGMSRTNQ